MKLGAKLLHPQSPVSEGASVNYECAYHVIGPCYALEQPLKQQLKVAVGAPRGFSELGGVAIYF